jgi:putative ABC transport system permease protein
MKRFAEAARTEILTASVDSLRRHSLRTALSAIAVAVGVAGLAAMMAVAEGARAETLRHLENFGAQTILIRTRTADDDATLRGRGRRLSVADAVALEQVVPNVDAVTPVVFRYANLSANGSPRLVTVLGVSASFHELRRPTVTAGRPLTDADVGSARVCLLGERLASELLGPRPALPARVRLDGDWFLVVGTIATRGGTEVADSGRFAAALDETVITPLGALPGVSPRDPGQIVSQIWLRATTTDRVVATASLVAHALSRRHDGIDDFEVVLPADLLAQRTATQRVFTVVTSSIAGLALLVGALGIANVLIVAVVERTPEIGLRRVVGATARWIASQFLVESLLTTTIGGIMGVIGGAALSMAIATYAGWPVAFSPMVAFGGAAAALAVGVTAGVYPAIRAARLQPIDAVRHE